MLKLLSKYRLYAEFGLLAALAAVFLLWQLANADTNKLRGSLTTAKMEIGRQAARADRNAAEAGRYAAAVDAMADLARSQAQQRAELNVLRNDVLRMINDAPPEDDGPLSPVLARTLERLRDHETPGAGSPVS